MADFDSRTTDESVQRPNTRSVAGGPRLLLVTLLLIPLTACATKGDIRDLGVDIRTQNQEQAALIAQLRQEQRALQDSINVLKAGQTDLRGTLLQRIAQLQTEVASLRELTGMSQQELAAMRDQLATRPSAGRSVDPGQMTGAAADLYEEALDQLRRGALTAARFGFEELIENHPDHALTPEARFYLGEILVEQGDPEAAIDAFLEVAEYHPSADRVPQAYYRVGRLYYEQGENQLAREYLQRVVNTWGNSGVADLARQLLDEIG